MSVKKKVNIVWLKRDLRLRDHAPLRAASAKGIPILLIYIFDPSLLHYEDSDPRHWRFVWQSLQDLQKQLSSFNGKIEIFHRNSLDVFTDIVDHFAVENVFSHQEIGNDISFQRDKEIALLLKKKNIPWIEYQTNGVIRGLKNRAEWDELWRNFMIQPPQDIVLEKLHFVFWDNADHELQSLPQECTEHHENFQPGGESYAWKYLISFLNGRHEKYSMHISKPQLSRKSCSRISPYLAYGNLSMRQVYQMTLVQLTKSTYKRGLQNFISRLHWHCHFIQKFESECRIEFENFNRAYDQIVKTKNPDFIRAFETGQTGIPIVDANIRCLIQTGYTNFRMRAMLVSFFCFNLWQDWRYLHFLARQFLDYEPGIHYPQLQMQAGTTGINTLRIYNPIKNALEHDADGTFVKTWIPELKEVPLPQLHTPWILSESEQLLFNCRIGIDYPAPIVNIEETQKHATEIMWAFKKNDDSKREGARILKTHVKSKPMPKKKAKKK